MKNILSNQIYGVLFTLAGTAITTSTVQAQSQQFSYTQYMENLTPLNPAYSMVDQGASIHTLARKQWVGIPGAPSTYLLNGNLPFNSIGAAAGLVVMNDSYTVEHQTEVNAYFAKSIHLGQDANLAVSLNAGLRNYVADYSSLSTTDAQFKNDVRETKPNLGFGVMFYGESYYLGVSVPELSMRTLGIASVQDQSNFTNHYYLAAGLTSRLSEDVKLKYAALASLAQNVPTIADGSVMAILKDQFGVGLNIRTNSEIAGIFNIRYDIFRLGYSYQFGASPTSIGGFSNATQEVSLSVNFGKKKK